MNKRFIGITGLSEYLDISKNTVYSWIWQRKIPYVKIGRLVKFDLRKIEDWIKERGVEEIT